MPVSDAALVVLEHVAATTVDPDCPADRHGSYPAHRRSGCRCRATVALVNALRGRWEVGSRARKIERDREARRQVREDVVVSLVNGCRRFVPGYTHAEAWEAFRRVHAEVGDDWRQLARRLDLSRHEVQRRLRRLRDTEERGAAGEPG